MLQCINALKGKNIVIRKPYFLGSLWHNYKRVPQYGSTGHL